MNAVKEPGRTGRTAGLVLIGIAVIALVIGVISLATGGLHAAGGGGQSSTVAPPPKSTTATPKPPNPRPTTQPSSSTGKPPVTTTTTAAPLPPAPDPHQVPIRVLNNGKISGFAAQAAKDFRDAGWNVVEVGNYKEGVIPTTTAYYRAGTEEEAVAKALAQQFNMRADVRFPGIAGASPGVIVMITNDYNSK